MNGEYISIETLRIMQELEKENKKLQEENERLKEWKEDLLKENIELENIRKEAIEYLHHFDSDEICPYKFYDKDELIEEILKNEDEIERLNNIIDELEKWLIEEYSKYNGAIRIANVLDKLKELKEKSDKE